MSSLSFLSVTARGCSTAVLACALGAGCVEAASNDRERSIDSISVERYAILDDGTVADSKTWLTWQQNVAPGLYTLAEAKRYCAELDLAGGGWQLPNLPELESLVDTTYFPTIDPIAFPDTPEEWAWTNSTSPYVDPIDDAWVVNFTNGESFDAPNVDDPFSVRCVR